MAAVCGNWSVGQLLAHNTTKGLLYSIEQASLYNIQGWGSERSEKETLLATSRALTACVVSKSKSHTFLFLASPFIRALWGLLSSYRGCLAEGDTEEGSGGGVVWFPWLLGTSHVTCHTSCFSFLSLLLCSIVLIVRLALWATCLRLQEPIRVLFRRERMYEQRGDTHTHTHLHCKSQLLYLFLSFRCPRRLCLGGCVRVRWTHPSIHYTHTGSSLLSKYFHTTNPALFLAGQYFTTCETIILAITTALRPHPLSTL